MKEFAFDAKFWAVVRVTAENEADARTKLLDVCSGLVLNHNHDGVEIEGMAIEDDSGEESDLIEIDGEAV